ncbi:MAG TPA: transketolase C-terminal domain-containing protein [Bacteriovoracaceae bacterium]|nr:transketolase C-terminal domain-containing protein [Bacteriovoracaceae bacterium]
MALKPLKIKSKLLPAPTGSPIYSITIKDAQLKDIKLANPKATRSLLALMDLAAVNGGAACHWGGPSAMTEAWTALHGIMFKERNWFENFNFVNDIGHAENGIYALRTALGFGDLTLETLKGFRSLGSKLTGHGESHLYPEGVLLSNGPLGSAFPQAQGLAVADKIAGNKRITVVSVSDGAAMEGEAKEAFSAVPGLAGKGKLNPFVLLVSDNNTKLGGRIDKDSFSMQPTFESLQALGWDVIKVDTAHQLETVYQILEDALARVAAKPTRPVCVWLKTTKGYGIKSTSDSASGGHGFPLKAFDEGIDAFLKEIWGEEKVPAEFLSWAKELKIKPEKKSSGGPTKDKIQVGVAKGLSRAAKEGLPVFSITSDLQSSTGLKAFHTEYPEHYLDVGVAESNMVSTAVGMSKNGFIPVVDTFAAFGVTKGNLPLIMGSLSQAPVIAIFSHTGFQDAADGASHQSLTYLSALSSIPHLNVVNVASAKEAEEYVYAAVKKIATEREAGGDGESYIFFIGRENFALEVQQNLGYQLHRSQKLTEGTAAAIVVSGSLVAKGLEAHEKLKEQGIETTVINHSFVNNSDFEQIAQWVRESGSVMVTVEDHQLIGGMGAQLIHRLKLLGSHFSASSLAVRGEFGQSAYSADELYAKHHLDSRAIVSAVTELMQKQGDNMNFDTEVIKQKWKVLSEMTLKQWDKISEKDLEKVKGNAVQMVSMFQEKLGVSREEATKKVEELIAKYDKEEIKAKVEKTAGKVFETANSIFTQVRDRMKK